MPILSILGKAAEVSRGLFESLTRKPEAKKVVTPPPSTTKPVAFSGGPRREIPPTQQEMAKTAQEVQVAQNLANAVKKAQADNARMDANKPILPELAGATIRAFPRAVASAFQQHKVEGQIKRGETVTPEYQPKAGSFTESLLGSEPVQPFFIRGQKDKPDTTKVAQELTQKGGGEQFGKDIGLGKFGQGAFGIGAVALGASDLIPGIGGAKKKVTKEAAEQLVKKYGKEEAEILLKKGGEKVVSEIMSNPKAANAVKSIGAKGFVDTFKVSQPAPAFEGLKDLSTSLVEKLKGRSTVSKQFISDLTNSGDLKQAEKDIIRRTLESEGDKVDVSKFADKVQGELLPLQRSKVGESPNLSKYENITLPNESRGNVENYSEHIYQSPIKTAAGNVHFGGSKAGENYFGHTRVEDMADNQTRRVIEVQSDLYQKGGLEKEALNKLKDGDIVRVNNGEPEEIFKFGNGNIGVDSRSETISPTDIALGKVDIKVVKSKAIAPLQQYNDPTAHFRMIREEVKKAAQDGKSILQFPTGETAMKIEGLGGHDNWVVPNPNESANENWLSLKPDMLKNGMSVTDKNYDEWLVTHVFDDGRFNAVPKNMLADTNGDVKAFIDTFPNYEETFDISGKADTNNPIYKFYDKEVGKYLKNKYGATQVTDDKGVTWWQVPVKKELAEAPVEAFGAVAGVQPEYDENGNITGYKIDPKMAALGLVGGMVAKKGNNADIYKNIVKAVKNSAHFRKEKSIQDILGSGVLMERAGKYVISSGLEKEAYAKKGYKLVDYIDSIANNEGFDSGNEFLDSLLQGSSKKVTKVDQELDDYYRYLEATMPDDLSKADEVAAAFTKPKAKANKIVPGVPMEPPVGRGGLQPPVFNFEEWKDGGKLAMGRETMERNLERVAGADAQKAKEFLVDPIRNNETARIEFTNKLKDDIRENVIKGLGIKAGTLDDKLIQRYGEGLITLDELKGLTKNWQKVEEASSYFRKTYDDLLDKVNAERGKFGYNPIPKREDYFRHFIELDNIINQFGLILREQDLPTAISGLTATFKPGKPFSNAELRRLGGRYTESAIKGMDNYLDSISRQMFHIDSVQRGRLLEKYVRGASIANEMPSHLNRFVSNLAEYTNLVSGKKAMFDRAFEDTLGRGVYGVARILQQQTSANMIAGNISSALTNFIPFTQSLATTSKPAAVRGLLEGLQAPVLKDLANIDGQKSSFLIRRFPDKQLAPVLWGSQWLAKSKDAAQFLFEGIDKFTARSIVSGKYFEGLKKGLEPSVAMKEADIYASRVMADRSVGQLPNLMNTRTLGFLTQFQTEVNNAYSFATKDIAHFAKGDKKKIASGVAQLVLFSYLFNEGYQQVMGRRPTIDPIYAGLTLAGMTDQSDDTAFIDRAMMAGEDVAGNLPFVGSITSGRLPLAAGLPDIAGLQAGKTTPLEEAKKVGSLLASPFGGLQVKKTAEGIASVATGEVRGKTGQLQYNVDQTPMNYARGTVFGKGALELKDKVQTETLFNRLDKQNRDRSDIANKAEDEYKRLKSMPKEEANRILDELESSGNPLYEKIKDVAESEKKGLTLNDRLVKQLGVENGERAKYIWEEAQKLETREEKNAYLEDMENKGLISKDVSKQLFQLSKSSE